MPVAPSVINAYFGFLSVTGGGVTIPAGGYAEFTSVMLNEGPVPAPFERAGKTLDGELALCQRYCYAIVPSHTSSILGIGFAASTTGANITVKLPSMRVAPTLTAVTAASDFGLMNGAIIATLATIITDSSYTPDKENALLWVTTTGLTSFTPYALYAKNLTGILIFSAEI